MKLVVAALKMYARSCPACCLPVLSRPPPPQAWSDPGAKKLRRDMANRVLGICKVQRRGALAVRLLQLGARLAPKGREELPWPGPGPYWAAMEAVRHESEAYTRRDNF